MSLTERQTRKFEARMRAAVGPLLAPGEEVRAWVFGVVHPRLWLHMLIENWTVLLMKRYFVVVTDRRLLLVRLRRFSKKVRSVDWDEPPSGIRVEHVRVALNVHLRLRRIAGGKAVRLRVARILRAEVDRLVAALGQAGAPEASSSETVADS